MQVITAMQTEGKGAWGGVGVGSGIRIHGEIVMLEKRLHGWSVCANTQHTHTHTHDVSDKVGEHCCFCGSTE